MTPKAYIEKPRTVVALQLLWSTWSDMCDFVKVGRKEDGRPTGVFVTGKNVTSMHVGNESKLGLQFPIALANGALAVEGDWIIQHSNGVFSVMTHQQFTERYQEK